MPIARQWERLESSSDSTFYNLGNIYVPRVLSSRKFSFLSHLQSHPNLLKKIPHLVTFLIFRNAQEKRHELHWKFILPVLKKQCLRVTEKE